MICDLFVDEFGEVQTFASQKRDQIPMNFSLLLKIQLLQSGARTLNKHAAATDET